MNSNITEHNFIAHDQTITHNRKKTILVVIITSCMLLIEIIAGYITGSMALLADGWHMATHAGALFISVLAYNFAQSEYFAKKLSFGGGKFIPLGGYTNAILLAIVALFMALESVKRLLHPQHIQFKEAIGVTMLGFIVNIVCAYILMSKHHNDHDSHHNDHDSHHNDHDSHHNDHNLRSASIHVIADALTSIFAFIALSIGLLYKIVWLDPLMAIVGSVIILKWAYNLCKYTAMDLLDCRVSPEIEDSIKTYFSNQGMTVVDLHVWRIAPNTLSCNAIIESSAQSTSHFKTYLLKKFGIGHATIEVLQRR